ncbi:MAG: NAD(P)/FAD-dependent oxidoreductase [Clostridia bacterium]|nr:NAD(P)/FAD-dependent oxidoreductase [Clostridia bacterium]
MALILSELKMPLHAEESSLKEFAARALNMSENAILSLQVKRISLDARKKDDICFSYTVEVTLSKKDEARALKKGGRVAAAPEKKARELTFGTEPLPAPIVVVGLGPAGLFAAYTLAKYGYKPIVIERGRDVDSRRADVADFWKTGRLNESSNAVFGEGGAGTFSDGKLTTRIKDLRSHDVVDILAQYGAPEEIRVMAKPHIGTDKLVSVVKNMRLAILHMGGEVRFETRFCGVERQSDRLTAIYAQTPAGRERIPCAACILATGHGASDTYRLLSEEGFLMQAKPFAMGVRIEHPRELIDRSQYGKFAGHPRLGAAEYHLSGQSGDRGVYTFCMCPGGQVVACSSEQGGIVTNGMSHYARNAENSNAAVIVQVDERDYDNSDPLAGLRFREELERAAFRLGGGDFVAPAAQVGDYLAGRTSKGFGSVKPSYTPGVKPSDLSACLPDFMAAGIRDGIRAFGRKLKGYDMPEAVITAVESRTSAPVRILRNELGEAPTCSGFYPAGEGAGYAGGIVSAAVDGMRAAERVMEKYKPCD